MARLPGFLIKRIPKQENIRRVRNLLNDSNVHTVCEEARCPNIGECFERKTCAFLILGDTCTRNCAFCGVKKGTPRPPDPEEPQRIARAVEKLGLNYVVITSVTRDDLPDGGASHFASTIYFLLSAFDFLKIEVLIPDFQGNRHALETVLDAHPFVLNHNLETVPRLYPKIRPQANYERSLDVLRQAKQHRVYIKSGFMIGLGEKKEEVFSVLADLKAAGCEMVTIGQYLPPSKNHIRPERYVLAEEYAGYEAFEGLKVFAGPFVRSSYRADKILEHSCQASEILEV